MVSICKDMFKLYIHNFHMFLEIRSPEVFMLVCSYVKKKKQNDFSGWFTVLANTAMCT